MHRLNGKVALITGAASGIGQATAILFAQQGAKVVATDIHDDKGKELANSVTNNLFYHHLNVMNEHEWQDVIEKTVHRFGKLDILINNAGIAGFNEDLMPLDPEHSSYSSWQIMHKINLDSVFLGCKYAIAEMKHNKNCAIVNISSRLGIVGIPHNAAYASAKAAVRNLTKSIALYCAKNNYSIRCNSIHPGAILTPLWDAWLGQGEQRQQLINEVANNIPMQHLGTANDVADAILFLASDEARYITGSELIIDGGILSGSTADIQ